MVSSTLILSCVLLAAVAEAKISGQFVDRAGVKCKYYEDRLGGGKGTRSMVVNCGKSYNCRYTGNPHNCRWYNKNQPAFYECLVGDLRNAANACAAPAIDCEKKCPGVEMKKEGVDMGLLREILFGQYESNGDLVFGDDEFEPLEFDNYY